jgi:16S rRNA (guanine966-N2)-methyltransferase
MRLRITSGELRGRIITLSGALERFRPTLERHRQAIANSLAPRIGGAAVADLCAGSGAFGLEMLSRGAGHADFVEHDRRRAEAIRQHAERFGVSADCRVFGEDIRRFAVRPGVRYDILYYDPPYEDDELAAFVPSLFSIIADGGVLVYERAAAGRAAFAPPAGRVHLKETRSYGIAAMDVYEAAGEVRSVKCEV